MSEETVMTPHAAEMAADALATAQRTAAGGYARDIDGDGELEYAGANPLYLGISGAGVALVVASLMTWATSYGTDVVVSGMERVGVVTMIIGAALVVLGLLGWAYNPWSDPEAMWALVLSALGLGIVICCPLRRHRLRTRAVVVRSLRARGLVGRGFRSPLPRRLA